MNNDTSAATMRGYETAIAACIHVIKARPINDTDRELIERLRKLLPQRVETAVGDDWRRPL